MTSLTDALAQFQIQNDCIAHTYQKVDFRGAERPMYLALGLVGEAGEVAEKVKKWARNRTPDIKLKEDLLYELGDVLWYMARLASTFGLSLNEIAAANLAKLADRRERGVIASEGDHR